MPHDDVYALMAPENLDASVPWVLAGNHFAHRSTDGGESWVHLGGAASYAVPIAGGVLADGRYWMCDEERVWISSDGELFESLTAAPAELRDCAVEGTDLYLATEGGMYHTDVDAVGLVALQPGNWIRVDVSAEHALVARNDDTVWIGGRDLGALELVSINDGAVSQLEVETVAGVPEAYVGYADGAVRAWDGELRDCGALGVEGDWPDVVALSIGDSGLLAAPAQRGPFLSTDGCASWMERSIPVETEFQPTVGGARYAEEAFTAIFQEADKWVVAGWAGLYISEDGGQSWSERHLASPARLGSLSYHMDFPDNPRIFMGTYSAGPAYSDAFGATLEAPAQGVGKSNVRHVLAVPDHPDRVWSTVDSRLYLSEDGGISWEQASYPVELMWCFKVFEGDEMWVFDAKKEDYGSSRGHYSLDGGDSWSSATELEEVLPAAMVGHRFEWDGGMRWCAASHHDVACADAIEGPWSITGSLPSTVDALGFAHEPTADPSWLALATTKGVHTSIDGGDSWLLTYDGSLDPLADVAALPTGEAVAVTGGGRLLSSPDAIAWEDMGIQVPAHALGISIRPDYLDYPEIVVATAAGAYIVREDAEGDLGVHPLGAVQRVDSQSLFVECEACVGTTTEYRLGLAMDLGTRLHAGVELHTWIAGDTIEVYGQVDSYTSVAQLLVDGEVVGLIGLTPTPDVELLLEVGGLENRVHDVSIRHVSGAGVLFDYLLARAPGETLTAPEPPEDNGWNPADTLDTALLTADTGFGADSGLDSSLLPPEEEAGTDRRDRPQTGPGTDSAETGETGVILQRTSSCAVLPGTTGLGWISLAALAWGRRWR